jgi:hypothetical protein
MSIDKINICENCLNPCKFRIEHKGRYLCQRCYSHSGSRNHIQARISEDVPSIQDLMDTWNNRGRFHDN